MPRSSSPPPGLSAPPSPPASGVRVAGWSAPSASGAPVPRSSAPPSPSSHLLVPGSFSPPPKSSAPPSLFVSGMRVSGSSTPSASGTLMPGSSAPPSPSSCLPMPGLSAPLPESSLLCLRCRLVYVCQGCLLRLRPVVCLCRGRLRLGRPRLFLIGCPCRLQCLFWENED